MKLVSYRAGDGARPGVQTDDGVLDAAGLLGIEAVSAKELISAARLGELAERVSGAGVDPVTDPELLPPVRDPDKVICIGLNYRSHAAEAGIELVDDWEDAPPDEPTETTDDGR